MSSDVQGWASIPRAMLFDREIPTDAKLIYLLISSHVGGSTTAWPSRQRLADMAGLSLTQTKAMIRWLRDNDYIAVVARLAGDGTSLSNEYKLMVGSTTLPDFGRGQVTPPLPEESPALSQSGRGQGAPPRGRGAPPNVSTKKEQLPNTSAMPTRIDVEALCKRLADKIEGNGSKRPTVTKGWRDSARLLLDRDSRTQAQVERAIDWCQADDFWKSNILSMPTLRKQYDRLRLAAQRAEAPKGPRMNLDEAAWLRSIQ